MIYDRNPKRRMKKQLRECPLGNNGKYSGTLCNSYARKMEQFH